ncbi:hypothetical protein [Saccharopolyspora sp. NPDC002376]
MVALTDAVPLTAADGVTGVNNGRDMRKFISGLLLPDVKSANPLAVRNGVLPHNWDAVGCTSLRVQQQGTASMNVDVLAGHLVCERTGQGPYLGWSESTVSVPIATSNATNPRIDVVFAVVYDQASIPTDPAHGPVVDVLAGAPAASPVAPTNLPDGAIKLAEVRVPANATTITAANITDKRMSTALTGGVRYMLPGDAVLDPGRIDGELRIRKAAAPWPQLMDYWDAAQGLWRGTMGATFTQTFPGSPDGNNNVTGVISGANNTLITLNIPDPGFPYRVIASTLFKIISINNPTTINYYVNVNNNQFAGAIGTAGPGGDNRCPVVPIGATIYTGASTVRLKIDVLGGGSITWGADVRNPLTVQVVPA